MTVILGLGSNMGDRLHMLRQAIEALKEVLCAMRFSTIVESPAMLPTGAPIEWDKNFLNMAVSGETNLAPDALLAEIKHIEVQLGRTVRGVWGPREIDIDILAMDDTLLETSTLAIPHPGIVSRDFALMPLAELVPNWRYPGAGKYHGWSAAHIVADQRFSYNNETLRQTEYQIDE